MRAHNIRIPTSVACDLGIFAIQSYPPFEGDSDEFDPYLVSSPLWNMPFLGIVTLCSRDGSPEVHFRAYCGVNPSELVGRFRIFSDAAIQVARYTAAERLISQTKTNVRLRRILP